MLRKFSHKPVHNEDFKYVFRGTTVGFSGNATSNKIPVTCATYNPAKALLFALSASHQHKTEGVVYVAERRAIASFYKTVENCFVSYEEELAFVVRPGIFQSLCSPVVSVGKMRAALPAAGVKTDFFVHTQNLSELLKETQTLTPAKILGVVENLNAQKEKL